MARYKITCRCVLCGHRWSRFTANPDSPDPPCPRVTRWDDDGKPASWCGQEVNPIGMDLTIARAPATIGASIQVKAIDETAKIVMEEHGFTDLRDDVRPGETMAPKLHPNLQAQADNFFGGPPGKRQTRGFNPGMHAAAAMRGAFSDPASTGASLGAVHANRTRPPVHLVGDDRVARR